MPDKVELKVGGAIYGGWESMRISRGIEQISGSFELSVTDRWAGQAQTRPIRAGDPCQVLLGNTPVITGYVDHVRISYGARNHSVTVVGRDKTGDLVDCAAIYKGGQWFNSRVDDIARDLCKPFGVDVIVKTDVGAAFKRWNIEDSESVFDNLERAARMKAFLLVSDGLGRLVFTRASNERVSAELVEGKNILEAEVDSTWSERFGTYMIKGQQPSDDEVHGVAATQVLGRAEDPVIDRYRPLIVLAEDNVNLASAAVRAQWEKNVRIGRGSRGTVTVQGWRQGGSDADGELWEPNRLVRLRSPMFSVDADMLIASCHYLLDERGSRTELTVCRREAFELVAGIGSSRLNRKLNDKMQAEKHKKGDYGMFS